MTRSVIVLKPDQVTKVKIIQAEIFMQFRCPNCGQRNIHTAPGAWCPQCHATVVSVTDQEPQARPVTITRTA